MEFFGQTISDLLGLTLNPAQREAFQQYSDALREWNERVNLTAITDPQAIEVRHFVDSLACLLVMKPPLSGLRIIDVGSGAGFPGIPLKILYPSMRLTLVESVGKKANFCRHMVETLKLEAVEVLTARAEEAGQMPAHREKYDWAVARAVANLPVLVEYLLPLVHMDGTMLAQKGQSGPAEAHKAEKAIKILGGRLRQLIPVTLPGIAEDRYLVIVDKVAATPSEYPRHPGEPAKKPL